MKTAGINFIDLQLEPMDDLLFSDLTLKNDKGLYPLICSSSTLGMRGTDYRAAVGINFYQLHSFINEIDAM